MKNKTRKIYIVLTYTGTILSKIIRVYTGAEYCHVSSARVPCTAHMETNGESCPYIGAWPGIFPFYRNQPVIEYQEYRY